MSILYIFDFDDTLAMTNSHVRVIKKDGSVDRLNSRAFAKYRPKPGDKLDFSEFTEASGTLIDSTVQTLKNAIQQHGYENVYIVTARDVGQPVTDFLTSMGIDPPEVVATAGSEGKATWLTRQLELNDYTNVYVYEDCRKNITMLRDIVEVYNEAFPDKQNIEYNAICVLPSGEQQVVEYKIRRLIRKIVAEQIK